VTEDVARLHRLGQHLAVLESPDFSFGAWVPMRELADGSFTMPYYEPSSEAEAFLADARALVHPFDWPAWASSPEGQRLLGHPEAVASASAEDLGKLLTTYVRSERFGEGTLAGAYESGMLTAIARRASVLARELGSAGDPNESERV
jgi:hypothetical protein